jgi:hypothetical protein
MMHDTGFSKKIATLTGLVALLASVWSHPVNALTFHYSLASVEGFISGLQDNQNFQAATSVTVTASPLFGGLGEYAPGTQNSWNVAGGVIGLHAFNGTVGSYNLAFSGPPSTGSFANPFIGFAFQAVPVFELVPDVPLPAALPLFATGLGALGLLAWRRKRRAQAGAA